MNKKEALKHKKKKSHKLQIVFWVLLCSAVSVATALAFACFGAESLGGILGQRDYWLSVGVVNGLIMIFYLMMYKVDAANVVTKENDLEDTEFLTAKNLKKSNIDADIDTRYTAQDWEGFQELVSKSNIQDKELILRVLSMYSDPEEREREIKNISTVYRTLADDILPQLRRSRLTLN